jgi:hypothetical protein
MPRGKFEGKIILSVTYVEFLGTILEHKSNLFSVFIMACFISTECFSGETRICRFFMLYNYNNSTTNIIISFFIICINKIIQK